MDMCGTETRAHAHVAIPGKLIQCVFHPPDGSTSAAINLPPPPYYLDRLLAENYDTSIIIHIAVMPTFMPDRPATYIWPLWEFISPRRNISFNCNLYNRWPFFTNGFYQVSIFRIISILLLCSGPIWFLATCVCVRACLYICIYIYIYIYIYMCVCVCVCVCVWKSTCTGNHKSRPQHPTDFQMCNISLITEPLCKT